MIKSTRTPRDFLKCFQNIVCRRIILTTGIALLTLIMANVEAQIVTKQLYLSDPSQALDRVDPIATADNTTSQTGPLIKNTATVSATSSGQTGSQGNPNSLTISHSYSGTGVNRILLVTIASTGSTPVTTVTYNTLSLKKLGEKANGATKAEIWYLINPPTGIYNVVINWSGTLECSAGVITMSNVDQVEPFGTGATNSGTSDSPTSLTVPSQVGDIVIDIIAKNGQDPSAVSPQTSIFSFGTNSIKCGSSYKTATANNTSMAWTYNGNGPTWSTMGVAVKGYSNDAVFTQSPALCSNLTIKAGAINVLTYATVASGSMIPFPNIVAELSFGTTLIARLTAPTAWGGAMGTSGTITWTGGLASDVLVPSGQQIVLTVYNDMTSMQFNLLYDSQNKPSKITFTTSNYISLSSLAVYNSPYNGGSVITQRAVGFTNYIRAVVTDPFGYGDITALNLSINSGASVAATSVATTPCTNTFEYAWTPTTPGNNISIQATAKEGYENAVTSTLSTNFTVVQPALTLTKTLTNPATGPYTLNDNLTYTLSIHNTGLSTLTTIPLQDIFDPHCLQYVSASIPITSLVGGTIYWANLAGTGLAPGGSISLTVTLKVIGNCDPATNQDKVEGAKDNLNYIAATVSASSSVNIDEPPVAVDDHVCLNNSSPVNISVLSNDTDPDIVGFISGSPGTFSVSISTPPPAGKGTAEINPDKTIKFTPGTLSENELVSFVYRVTDAVGYYSQGTVYIRYSLINDPPAAVPDLAGTPIDWPITIDVLSNDSDPDGNLEAPVITAIPSFGSVIVNSDKTVTYIPNSGFEGTDHFTYSVCDDGCPAPSACSSTTVTVSVFFAYYVCKNSSNTLIAPPVADATSYTWTLPAGASGSSTTNSINVNWSGVALGQHNVCVTAGNDCGQSVSRCVKVVVSDLSLSFAPSNILCHGNTSGSIDLTVNGGIEPYTYAWSNGASIQDPGGLTPGPYQVNVMDKYGCSTTGITTISQPASAISATAVITDENPGGSGNGSINQTVSGGTPGYTFIWSNGSTIEDPVLLTAGTYTVTITDVNGCTLVQRYTVNRIGGALTISSLTKTDVQCNAGSTGTVDLEIIGGNIPYTYQWTGPNGFTATSQDLSGRPAGLYQVTITDASSNTTSGSIIINQPASALSSVVSSINPSCYEANTGSIDITPSGGTSPYTYLWSTGAITQDLSSLASGTYNITITDANGCTTTNSRSLTQPTAITGTDVVTNTNCNPGNTGSVDISPTGGTPGYTYLWSNAAVTQDISGLAAGNYAVTVTDAAGCTVARSYQIKTVCLGVSKTVSSEPVNNQNGTYTLTYELRLENMGDIDLTNIQATEDLNNTFSSASGFILHSFTSNDFTVNPTFNGNTVTSLLASGQNLAPGEFGLVYLTLTVTPDGTLGVFNNSVNGSASGDGVNVADVSQNGTDPDPDHNNNPGNNSDPTPVTFTEHPLIGIAKSLSSVPVNNGDGSYNMAFTLKIGNYGDVPLKNVQISDNLTTTFGAGASITVTGISSPDLAVNAAFNGTTLLNMLQGTDIIPVNQIRTVNININITPVSAGPFNNTAVGEAAGPGGTPTTDNSQDGLYPDPDNNGDPTDNNVPTPITFTENPGIGLAKRVIGSPLNNHDGTYEVTYEFRVKNTGNVNFANIQVTDNLSSAFDGKPVEVLSISSLSLTVNNSYNGTTVLTLLSGSNTLLVGVEKIITLVIRVTPGSHPGPYNNTATAGGTSPLGANPTDVSNNGTDVDPENDGPGNNSIQTPVTFTESPQMGLAKTITSTVNNHDGTYDVTYSILVSNTGDVPLNNIQVTDNLASTFTGAGAFIIQSLSSGVFVVNPTYNGTSDINLLSGSNSLGFGASGTITLVVKVTPATKLGVYSNTAVGSSVSPFGTTISDVSENGTNVDPNNNGNPGDNSTPTPLTLVENPQLGIAKEVSSVSDISGGTYRVTYSIYVINMGDVPLVDIHLTDDLSETFSGAVSFSLVSLSNENFIINPSFNGSTDIQMLTGTNNLDYEASEILTLIVDVIPGFYNKPFNNTTNGYGTSPGGRIKADASENSSNPDPDLDGNPTNNSTPTPVSFPNVVIGAGKKVSSGPSSLGDQTYSVTYEFKAVNMGDYDLYDVMLFDTLSAQFGTYTAGVPSAAGTYTITSGPTLISLTTGSVLTLNPGYTGSGINTNLLLLTNGDLLQPGDEISLSISIRFNPILAKTEFRNQMFASGDRMQNGFLDNNTTDPSNDGDIIDTDGDGVPNETLANPIDDAEDNRPTVFTIACSKPVVASQSTTVCSGQATGLTLGASSTVPVSSYNITSINHDGLFASAGNPETGTGFSNSVISDDAWTNNTGALVDVIYTVVPVSASGCLGDAFTMTIHVRALTITCPSTVVTSVNSGCSATAVVLGSPIIGDNCPVASVSNDHPSSTFSLGNTTVLWTATDQGGNTATCNQTVTVINTPPTAVDDEYTVAENTISSPTSVGGNVFHNDYDAEIQSFTVTTWGSPSVPGGTLGANAQGIFNYTPPLGYTGTVTFTYSVCDSCGACETATVTIHVVTCILPPQRSGSLIKN